jgi:triosephosphate isomerase
MSKLIIANWKMNGNIQQIENDLSVYAQTYPVNNTQVVLALPSIYLYQASKIKTTLKAKFSLAAQDVSRFAQYGAVTGEVNALMLKELLVQYIIIGHSERRTLLGDSQSTLINKIENTIEAQMIPVFCIGEDKTIRDGGKYLDFLCEELSLLLQVKVPLIELVIAYEPIWAIGTGVLPTMFQISEVLKLIKAFVQNYLSHAKITLLYGGSVSGKNANEILNLPEVGGVLVGGASLKTDEFISICTY